MSEENWSELEMALSQNGLDFEKAQILWEEHYEEVVLQDLCSFDDSWKDGCRPQICMSAPKYQGYDRFSIWSNLTSWAWVIFGPP